MYFLLFGNQHAERAFQDAPFVFVSSGNGDFIVLFRFLLFLFPFPASSSSCSIISSSSSWKDLRWKRGILDGTQKPESSYTGLSLNLESPATLDLSLGSFSLSLGVIMTKVEGAEAEASRLGKNGEGDDVFRGGGGTSLCLGRW